MSWPFTAFGVFLVAACATKSSAPSGAWKSATGSDLDSGSAACGNVALEGPAIVSTCAAAQPPQPQGGTVADGTYTLESMTYYGFCPQSADRERQTWVVAGDRWGTSEEFLALNGDSDVGSSIWHIQLTASPQATSVDATIHCGPAAMGLSEGVQVNWDGYDASPGHLALYSYSPLVPGAVRVDSFVKR